MGDEVRRGGKPPLANCTSFTIRLRSMSRRELATLRVRTSTHHSLPQMGSDIPLVTLVLAASSPRPPPFSPRISA